MERPEEERVLMELRSWGSQAGAGSIEEGSAQQMLEPCRDIVPEEIPLYSSEKRGGTY